MNNIKLIVKAQADIADYLMLIDENSKWGADIYIEVSKDVPHAKMKSMSGTFRTKVLKVRIKISLYGQRMDDYF